MTDGQLGNQTKKQPERKHRDEKTTTKRREAKADGSAENE